MRATEVFTPGKLPEVTYVDDHLKSRAQVLQDALEMGAAVVSLSGPSKSGKTVFIEKNLGKDRLLQVTGAGIDSPGKLWDRVFDLIGTPVSKRSTGQSGFQGAIAGKISAEAALLVSAKGELGATGTWSNSATQQNDYAVDYLQLLIRELAGTELVVFIDDFHYIPKDVQIEISNQIKEAIRCDVKFVCASVPYHSDDAIRANPDLRGRAIKLDFNYWDAAELTKIARRGFNALNMIVQDSYIEALASEAAGSPQLMQALCLNTCFQADVRERNPGPINIDSSLNRVKDVCERTAFMSDYSSTFNKMKEGPRTRGQDRKGYLLKDGSSSDVYPLIIKAIALNPPELTIRYPNLQTRIASLCSSEIPSGSSVTGACFHMCSIANDSENQNIIEWDGDNDVIDIRDPYLLFFLRWAQ